MGVEATEVVTGAEGTGVDGGGIFDGVDSCPGVWFGAVVVVTGFGLVVVVGGGVVGLVVFTGGLVCVGGTVVVGW